MNITTYSLEITSPPIGRDTVIDFSCSLIVSRLEITSPPIGRDTKIATIAGTTVVGAVSK